MTQYTLNLSEKFNGNPNFQPKVPLLSACLEVLEINNMIVANDLRKQLQKAYGRNQIILITWQRNVIGGSPHHTIHLMKSTLHCIE